MIELFDDMSISDYLDDFLEHYGTPRHSGRYPWGSGEKYQRSRNFYSTVYDLRKQGYPDSEIATMLGVRNASELKMKYSIANAEVRASDRARVIRLKDKGYSKSEIGRIMGKNESSIRSLLDEVYNERSNKIKATADVLKNDLNNSDGFIDIGLGVSNRLDVSSTKFNTAVQMLLDEGGYKVVNAATKQVGTGEVTWQKVLAKEDIPDDYIRKNMDKVGISQHYDEGGELKKLEKPVSIDSNRILVRYGDEGGDQKDGLIELRRGVEELSLKDANYAQVRIAVDGTHYLKGMAMYGDFTDVPKDYDIIFNTNKKSDVPKKEVFKKLKNDAEDGNPFGASIKLDDELVLAQRHYIGKDGKEHLSALNIVSEEGNWESWKKSLASQFLSKQPLPLAKKQLDYAYYDKFQEFNDISKLTNPAVKRKMLESFADDCDSAAVHLKAAALPRQQSHVILPFPEMKDTEIYAPNFKNGTKVVLIRYPHGGKFEIPQLTVNNKVESVKKALGQARDAVGINSHVASILSGADFDGDTVLVIPNNKGAIKTQSPLAKLKDFDPKESYPGYEGMKVMTKKQKGNEMGRISNLITDMTLKGASEDELARAVKHSMVVIDAEKHKLNWRQSEIDNGIAALKKDYQKKEDSDKYGGASTLISRAKAEVHIPDRQVLYSLKDPKTGKKLVDQGIWVETGEKAYKETGRTKATKKKDKETGEVVFDNDKRITKTIKSTQMAEAKDARDLLSSKSSPLPMEEIYAEYANRMKALANTARKELLATGKQEQNKSARETYKEEVSSLKRKLNDALKNKPLERKAQALAQTLIKSARDANPDMDGDDVKKLRANKLKLARARVGANKSEINITDNEWRAIQAGAVSDNVLSNILKNTDMDKVKKLATPKHETGLSSSEKALATSMLASGYTRSDVADRLGVSTSTLSKYL